MQSIMGAIKIVKYKLCNEMRPTHSMRSIIAHADLSISLLTNNEIERLYILKYNGMLIINDFAATVLRNQDTSLCYGISFILKIVDLSRK